MSSLISFVLLVFSQQSLRCVQLSKPVWSQDRRDDHHSKKKGFVWQWDFKSAYHWLDYIKIEKVSKCCSLEREGYLQLPRVHGKFTNSPPSNTLAEKLVYIQFRTVFCYLPWCESFNQRIDPHANHTLFGQKLISTTFNFELCLSQQLRVATPFYTLPYVTSAINLKGKNGTVWLRSLQDKTALSSLTFFQIPSP